MFKIRLWIAVMLSVVSGLGVEIASAELKIAMPDSPAAHFTYRDEPLLSFGGMSDFVFYFPGSTYDYRQWTDWQAEHGMNHVRAYPPLSYRKMEAVLDENKVPREQIIFPYLETEPGTRRFDLERFNDAYWEELEKKLAYFRDKGIIVHLIVFNGWHITYEHSGNWEGHFFNPAVNINPATAHLASNEHAFYHSVADGRSDLIALQQAWVRKIAEVSAGFDNVYFDLVHELARNRHRGWLTEQDEWDKVKPWVDVMAATLRKKYKEMSGREAIVGMDGGPFTAQQRDWIYSRSYFDILIYGKRHEVQQSLQWREQYGKPFVPQESWDDNGAKWSYRFPDHRTHIRKYVWKMMMAKAQQIDIYVKPPKESDSLDDLDPPGLPHRYNPHGWSDFEGDAVLLRQFWNQIEDYGSLRAKGEVAEGPGRHRLVLSSIDEVLVYLASRTGQEGIEFPAATLRLSNLELNDGTYSATFFSPRTGAFGERRVAIEGRKMKFSLPVFIDDLMIHIRR